MEAWTGFTLVLLGFGLRLWAFLELAKVGVSEEALWEPQDVAIWTQRGPYRWMKHPAYVGSIAVMAGAGIWALGWPGIVLPLPAWPFFAQRMRRENYFRASSPVAAVASGSTTTSEASDRTGSTPSRAVPGSFRLVDSRWH